MIKYTTTLQKFKQKGEKTGWTYIEVSSAQANKLNPGIQKSYRVKGKLDAHEIAQVALVPMGKGDFILAVNGPMRKALGKEEGDSVKVSLSLDESDMPLSPDLLACLKDEPVALKFFNSLAPGHQRYFSNWIESAKTAATKTKRITQSIQGLAMKLDYGPMIRYFKNNA